MTQKVNIQKYAAYQSSGVDWMGDIPKHWEIKKLKHLFCEKKSKSNAELNCGSISFGKVVLKDDEKIPISTKASYQEVLKGEFLINPPKTAAASGGTCGHQAPNCSETRRLRPLAGWHGPC